MQESMRTAVLVAAVLCLATARTADADDCDEAAGEKAFVKCAACHSLEQGVHLAGPSLQGIIGRKAGTDSGFQPSFALEQSDVVWSAETLDAFLKSPMTYVPGIVMPFPGLRDDAERKALVCWLADK